MKRKRTKPERRASGVRALARALRASPSAVMKWKADPRWPFGEAPWPIEKVRAWRAHTLEPNRNGAGAPVDGSQLLKAKTAWVIEGVKRRRFDLEVAQDKYVLRTEADDRLISVCKAFREALFMRMRPIIHAHPEAEDALRAAWNDALDAKATNETDPSHSSVT